MRVRKRVKKNFARKMHTVRSKRRRRDIKAAYWGIFKWGRCKNLWNKITENDMSFASLGIKTEVIGRDSNGKRIFNVPREDAKVLARLGTEIVISDFEDELVIDGKKGKCSILYTEKNDPSGEQKKFITSSKLIISKLSRARQMEAEGTKVFPQPTRVFEVKLKNGMSTYDIE